MMNELIELFGKLAVPTNKVVIMHVNLMPLASSFNNDYIESTKQLLESLYTDSNVNVF